MHIRVDNLKKWFSDKCVLQGLNFTVNEGEFVALLGPSGCGKTTLLNILAGFLDVDDGSLTVGGAVWSKPGYSIPPERRNVGMVFQDFALWPHMTVYENIAFGLKVRKVAALEVRERVMEVLETVRMKGYAEKFPSQLSGGQKQRIAIARALAPRPSVLLMDEPLSSLDAKLREQMRWDMLEIIRRAHITTLYVTHDQAEALSMADRIILLNEGHIEQEGVPTDLYHSPRTPFAATFLGASNLLEGTVERVDDGVVHLDCHGHVMHANGVGKIGERLTFCIRPTDIAIYDDSHKPHISNHLAVLVGVVVERAFYGAHWQYRIRFEGTPNTQVEVWDDRDFPKNSIVYLAVPSDRCLLLEIGTCEVVTA
jgi:ABC-type Fe3+/spermidine/putrescine transport system ATPase subunit